MYLFFFKFFSHLDYYRILNRVPGAIADFYLIFKSLDSDLKKSTLLILLINIIKSPEPLSLSISQM